MGPIIVLFHHDANTPSFSNEGNYKASIAVDRNVEEKDIKKDQTIHTVDEGYEELSDHASNHLEGT